MVYCVILNVTIHYAAILGSNNGLEFCSHVVNKLVTMGKGF